MTPEQIVELGKLSLGTVAIIVAGTLSSRIGLRIVELSFAARSSSHRDGSPSQDSEAQRLLAESRSDMRDDIDRLAREISELNKTITKLDTSIGSGGAISTRLLSLEDRANLASARLHDMANYITACGLKMEMEGFRFRSPAD